VLCRKPSRQQIEESVEVADNQFAGDFFSLNPEYSGFEIASNFLFKIENFVLTIYRLLYL